MKTLPLPVRFELPSTDWEAVLPESLGVENAAFLAVRRNLPDDYSPTISISGGRRDDSATLEEIGDESLLLLRAQATEVELLKRTSMGTELAPAVTQLFGAVAATGGRRYDLRQAEVVAGFVDVDDHTRRVVIIYTFTCTYAQFDTIGREFQEFMATVKVLPNEESLDEPPPDGTAP